MDAGIGRYVCKHLAMGGGAALECGGLPPLCFRPPRVVAGLQVSYCFPTVFARTKPGGIPLRRVRESASKLAHSRALRALANKACVPIRTLSFHGKASLKRRCVCACVQGFRGGGSAAAMAAVGGAAGPLMPCVPPGWRSGESSAIRSRWARILSSSDTMRGGGTVSGAGGGG